MSDMETERPSARITDKGAIPSGDAEMAVKTHPAKGILTNPPGLWQVPFEEVPRELRRVVYGVEYAELRDSTGGQLWVTRWGWAHGHRLDPAHWFSDGQYSSRGEHISEATGAVFRVPSIPWHKRPADLIVKFSRVAQNLTLEVSSQFPGAVPRHIADEATFNDPFQEFGLLRELRNSRYGPEDWKIRTKLPLAIYSPGRSFAGWQLGRNSDIFGRHQRRLAEDQRGREPGETVGLLPDRQYVYLFQWVRGTDAARLIRAGVLSADQAAALVVEVIGHLAAKGFRILDMKPAHVILRQRSDGRLLTRRGRLVYALVDFEFLQRTEEYEEWRIRAR